MKKKRPMTKREKEIRAEVRADMRARGIIPPKKKPLNRKKFVKEATEEYKSTPGALLCMAEAAIWMTGSGRFSVSAESVGAAKVLKSACELSRLYSEKREAGFSQISFEEIHNRLKPILEA